MTSSPPVGTSPPSLPAVVLSVPEVSSSSSSPPHAASTSAIAHKSAKRRKYKARSDRIVGDLPVSPSSPGIQQLRMFPQLAVVIRPCGRKIPSPQPQRQQDGREHEDER